MFMNRKITSHSKIEKLEVQKETKIVHVERKTDA
jgi:hypothetical protein